MEYSESIGEDELAKRISRCDIRVDSTRGNISLVYSKMVESSLSTLVFREW